MLLLGKVKWERTDLYEPQFRAIEATLLSGEMILKMLWMTAASSTKLAILNEMTVLWLLLRAPACQFPVHHRFFWLHRFWFEKYLESWKVFWQTLIWRGFYALFTPHASLCFVTSSSNEFRVWYFFHVENRSLCEGMKLVSFNSLH